MHPADFSYTQYYNQVAQLLLQGSEGNFSSLPEHYIDSLEHVFSDGDISLVSAIFQSDGLSELTPEQVDEVLEILHKVNPSEYPDSEAILQFNAGDLLSPEWQEEQEFDYVEDNLGTAEKTEKVLKAAIESIFRDSIHSIRDQKGKFPSVDNNFLQQGDGTFAGVFSHGNFKFAFEVTPTEKGWVCTYRMDESSLDSLPKRLVDAAKTDTSKKVTRPVRSRGWR
jgi:hypothetical protein